ncbi:class I SAM-dependent methyltransferase [Streptomyces sp. NBC_00053]|nr:MULTISPECIES: class I SAM-dependent methyltransferase [unclassified Streptomyces]WSG51929.1 class I SAM-dependent methyltransferase [Streptomyces sp. NBC_01732]WSX02585.1 class I SAM-dependent methyltransferase [Streptomyces sp. NBC_00987]MCX4395495.1 class I SAM-dependent methyltransferase [Streptomyces sp. NBC_01767]MCX5101875.1 class I SAM-dependent methyltransferase [Streptomyces sp. NBC_00439]MCX5161393.1 class I SAM-dependent methyltransferase [Streptomyces sp. NBC_00305]
MHKRSPILVTEPTPTLLERLPVLRRGLDRLERRPTAFGLVMWPFGLAKPVFLDHVVAPEPRAEISPVCALLEKSRERYAEQLTGFLEYADQLAGIPLNGVEKAATAYWGNTWLPPLDALSLYGFLASERPARYLEVGSGNSTKFARRAIQDLGLSTRITSIDPEPRAHIDHLCDEVVRLPLQEADLGVFAELEPGDILFIDGSHRLQMGSDVMVFFFELLPRLKPGVLIQVHDIMLPADYPESWRWRLYSEQYLLAALLTAAPERFDVRLPNAFIHADPELRKILALLWRRLGVTRHFHPGSFWWRHAG